MTDTDDELDPVEAPEPETFRVMPRGDRLFRCYNCPPPAGKPPGVDFTSTADKPVCPVCGADMNDPVSGRFVEPLHVVHFEPVHPLAKRFGRLRGTVGSGEVACLPGVAITGQYIRSGEPAAVNCPACKDSDAFREQAGAVLNPRFDVPVKVTGRFEQQLDSGPDGPRLDPPLKTAPLPPFDGDAGAGPSPDRAMPGK